MGKALRRALPLLAVLLGACAACPPAWVERPPDETGWRHAIGSCGEVYVEADARNIALTRAARHLADELGVEVERRLSVVWVDGRLYVEAVGSSGPIEVLDELELVDQAECDGVTHVLVRLPRT